MCSATIIWPRRGEGDEGRSLPTVQELEVPLGDDNHIPVGTASAAYVLLIEAAPFTPSVSPNKTDNKDKGNKEKAEEAEDDDGEIPYTVTCTGTGSVTPLTPEIPLTRSIRADGSHYYSFATPVYDKDIIITLTSKDGPRSAWSSRACIQIEKPTLTSL